MSKISKNPLSAGDTAPDFNLPATPGEHFSLSDHKGRKIILFFYPKDDTSGCTKEAIEFTSKLAELEESGFTVVGMSPDTLTKHEKFRNKHDLGMVLVSDEEKTALEAYGVWVEKSMYGRKYMGVERSTFMIDANGKITNAWRKVKVPGHVDEVLAAAKQS